MDTSRNEKIESFLTNWQKRFVRFSTKKNDDASAWLTSGHEKNFTSVGGRKNFPLVVLDDTLGDNLITWPLNLLWVKGDFRTFWHRVQEVYERPYGVPYSKTSAEKQLTFKV